MSEQDVQPGRPGDSAAPFNVAQEPFDMTPPAEAAADQPPPARSNTRVIVLGSLLVLVLLAAAVFGVAGWRILRQKDATLSTPDTVAGLRRDNTAQAVATADYLRTALAAEVDLDETIGVVYEDPASEGPAVLLFGGTTLFWTPESDLDTAFELLSDDTGTVTNLKEFPAGPFGGVLKCGDTSPERGEWTVCGWADHGSLALAMFPGRPIEGSAELMGRIRKDVQSRS